MRVQGQDRARRLTLKVYQFHRLYRLAQKKTAHPSEPDATIGCEKFDAAATITHNQESWVEVDVTVGPDAEIRFWHKESTESCCDELWFYVDGVFRGEWAGSTSWSEASFTLTEGDHTLRWRFEKDGSVNTGQDAVWIDDITLIGGGLR